MTIQEAKKLAMQGQTVIAPNGQEFLPDDFKTDDTGPSALHIFTFRWGD